MAAVAAVSSGFQSSACGESQIHVHALLIERRSASIVVLLSYGEGKQTSKRKKLTSKSVPV